MAFTYGYDWNAVEMHRVRFEVGDTGEKDEAGTVVGYFLEDEEITALLGLDDATWQTASLMAIRAIIAKLSRPTFQADWLKVDNTVALKSYRALLAEKSAEYGIPIGEDLGGWFESGSVDVSRSDVSDYP